jgi:hypothetical protein
MIGLSLLVAALAAIFFGCLIVIADALSRIARVLIDFLEAS